MASNYWAKIWIETLDDRKVASLPDNLWRRFFECVLLAKEINQSGRLPPVEDIAWRLRVDVDTLSQELDALARRDLVDYRADEVLDGYWFVVNFEKRQARMTGAERVKRHRESAVKQLYNDSCNDSVTKRYTETETESEEETEKEKDINIRFSKLSSTFWSITGIPVPSAGGRGWDDWEDGINQLLKIDATTDEMKKAKIILDEGGYNCTRPGALVNTITNMRNKSLRKKQSQSVGGELIE